MSKKLQLKISTDISNRLQTQFFHRETSSTIDIGEFRPVKYFDNEFVRTIRALIMKVYDKSNQYVNF